MSFLKKKKKKKERQEVKTNLVQWEERGHKERVKEGKYVCIYV
jgi:hypothetical protein